VPCYVTGSAEGDARLGELEARKELTRVTRVACELWELVQSIPMLQHNLQVLSGPTLRWIREHQKIDRRRRKHGRAH
jgi:hypothetical protein